MSNEENKVNKEQVKEEISEEFNELDEFITKGEKDIEKKEEAVEAEIEKEEEKVEELEEKKEEIDEKKKKIEEEIREEKEKVEELKKEEESLKKAEEKAEEIKEEVREKGAGIAGSIDKVKQIFKREKKVSSEPSTSKPFYRAIYEDHYKKLLIIPFLLLLLAVVQIGYQYSTTGDFVNRGVDLKGGITVTIPEKTSGSGFTYDIDQLEIVLNQELGGDISVRSIAQTQGLLIEASDVNGDDLISKLEEILGELDPKNDYSMEQMGSTLGSSFFLEITKAIALAFILMGVVVFITFRVPAPSLAVILAALSDIIITLAIFNLTGAKLGKGGIAAFLMLIGYSVDTDILLSTKVLKRKFGTPMKRIYSAMKTGLTMNITTIVAISVAIMFTQSEVIKQIMTILLIGLFVDIVNTWIQNVGILRLYLERKKAK